MESLYIRRFNDDDASIVSKIVCRNFMEVNIKDYSRTEMEHLSETYNSKKILDISGYAHMYVACLDKTIVGTGSIGPYWGSETESSLFTIFVLPEYQGQGIGKKIVETLEKDEYFLRAIRTEVPASITACEFYKKMGYDYKDGIKKLDDEGHYKLEKFRKIVR